MAGLGSSSASVQVGSKVWGKCFHTILSFVGDESSWTWSDVKETGTDGLKGKGPKVRREWRLFEGNVLCP